MEMDSILQALGCIVPSREILEAIAQRFSNTAERSGKVEVSAKKRVIDLRAKVSTKACPLNYS